MTRRERAYNLGRVCTCGTAISNRAAQCRPCFYAKQRADTERGKKIGAALKARLNDPANRIRHREAARRAGRTKAANPEFVAKARQIMLERVQPLSMTPENLAKRDYALTGRLSGESKMAWCPPEYRDEYRYLVHTKKLAGAEARAMVLAQAKADRERAAAKVPELSPFERQELALRNGAALQDNAPVTSWSPAAIELRAKIA